MPNRLADAASPYLRSHAGNPVDWWPWGPEPFAEAKARDIPVMVSIGYSTCHWCHVMARESFSDPEVAAFMNENLVAIKVDREEHAEVDATYLAAAAAFTENLGWPLNVFVTPGGRAFFAGTYWPPQPVGDHPAFRQVLEAVLDAWRERRDEVEANGAAIVDALSRSRAHPGDLITDFAPLVAEFEQFEDVEYGGFGTAPKFPVSPALGFLQEVGSELATRTLDAMAASPLRDPVEGGFFRYSTRRDWSEPHYERMLYDNAQLIAAYARAGRADVAAGIADWLAAMQQPGGGFASAQDSESTVDGQRVEGFYYTLDAASRARVEPPPTDAKVLTGWNGLAIEGLAIAGTLLERPEWMATAARAADFLLAEHVLDDRLVRASIDGTVSTARATLEDHGMLASGLLHLATATGEVRYAAAARSLVDASMAAATDAAMAAGQPFGTPDGADPVLVAQGLAVEADPSDGAHPSGLSAMASAAHRLYLLTAHAPYLEAARAAMRLVAAQAVQRPVSFGAALALMARLAQPVRQLVVVGDDPELASYARRQQRGLSTVVSLEQAVAFADAGFELYEGRTRDAAYLCEDFVCRLPVETVVELERAHERQ